MGILSILLHSLNLYNATKAAEAMCASSGNCCGQEVPCGHKVLWLAFCLHPHICGNKRDYAKLSS